MYKAKTHGRNCVYLAPAATTEPAPSSARESPTEQAPDCSKRLPERPLGYPQPRPLAYARAARSAAVGSRAGPVTPRFDSLPIVKARPLVHVPATALMVLATAP